MLKNYRNNLIIMLISYVVAMLSNMHLFMKGNIIHFLYGVVMIILGILTLYCLILFGKNIENSSKIAVVIGPIMSMIIFVEGFMYGKGFIIKFRITILFIMVGGILIYRTAKKIIRNGL